MSDQAERTRYEALKERKRAAGLTEPESGELAQLEQRLCDVETTALAVATSQTQQQNDSLQAELAQLQSEEAELEALLARKERFLFHTRALARRIEAERQDLLASYQRITGEELRELGATQAASR